MIDHDWLPEAACDVEGVSNPFFGCKSVAGIVAACCKLICQAQHEMSADLLQSSEVTRPVHLNIFSEPLPDFETKKLGYFAAVEVVDMSLGPSGSHRIPSNREQHL